MEPGNILGWIASAIMVVALITYAVRLRRPNPATWLIFAIVGFLNAVSYIIIGENIAKTSFAIANEIMMIVIFITALLQAKFSRIEVLEKSLIASAVLISTIWLLAQTHVGIFLSAAIANILIQITLVGAMIPTFVGIIRGENKEYPLPWIMVMISHAIVVTALLIDYNGNIYPFIYPIVTGIIGNGSIAIAAKIKE